MFELQRVRPDHATALLDFEQTNRAYFAQSISDRGDAFFEHYAEQHRALLAEQEAGIRAFYLLMDGDGKIVGRFNLYDIGNGTAEVGYRVAQGVAGRGTATNGLRMLCRVARKDHGLHTLQATTTTENVASQRVLEKAGFAEIGDAEVAGRAGMRFELALTNS